MQVWNMAALLIERSSDMFVIHQHRKMSLDLTSQPEARGKEEEEEEEGEREREREREREKLWRAKVRYIFFHEYLRL